MEGVELIMKFTVEVEDFWLEEEELKEALVSRIKRDVVFQILESVKKQTESQIKIKLQEVIKQKIDLVIDSTLTDMVAAGTIIDYGKEISIVDHVKNVFQDNNTWSDPTRQIASIAQDFTEELKKQYNVVFANNIVQKMKEQGFLKDDLVQVLLTGKKED